MRTFISFVFLFFTCQISIAADAKSEADSDALESRAQLVKQDLIELGKDMEFFEQDMIYPATTRLEVFVSMDIGRLFTLEGINLLLDDQPLAIHDYFSLEADGFKKGAVQKLYVGNVPAGKHEIKVFFKGKGPHARKYKRGLVHGFEKKSQSMVLELRILDDEKQLQPTFIAKEWHV
jgi:hypothetical protein